MRIGLEQQQAGRSSPARRRHAAGAAGSGLPGGNFEAPTRAADAADRQSVGRDARGRLMPILELTFTAGTVRVTVERVMVMVGAEI